MDENFKLLFLLTQRSCTSPDKTHKYFHCNTVNSQQLESDTTNKHEIDFKHHSETAMHFRY